MRLQCILILLMAALDGGAAHLARAQSAPAMRETDQLEEVVVTATRREQTAQTVPISISTLSADDLARSGRNQMRDLVETAPNLSEQGSFGRTAPSFFIRGIGSTQFNPNANSKVGVFVDDVYLNSPAVQGAQLFDIDRVEIARGPQGTLFGQNTTAGLIHAITNRPIIGGGFLMDGQLTVGSLSQLDPQVAVGFDTSTNSAARISILDQNRDGPSRNLLTGNRDGRTQALAWRAQWFWKPQEDLDLLLSFHGSRDRSDITPYKNVGLVDPATGNACPDPRPGSGCTNFFGYADTSDFHQGSWVIDHQKAWVDALGVSGTLTWRLPAFTVTSVSAFERNTSRILEDTGASPDYDILGSDFGPPRQFSQELRLTSPVARLSWIAGIYYFHESLDSSVAFPAPGFGPSVFSGVSGFLEGLGQVSSMKTDSYAAFGNLDYDMTDRLKLSLGLRYTHERKVVRYDAFLDEVDGLLPADFVNASFIRERAFVQTIDFSRAKDWNNISGRAALSYKLNDQAMLYASVARGFNSGNYNGGAFFNQSEATLVNPETLMSYELGLKSEIGRNLRINVDGFYYDFRNQQVFILATDSSGSPVQQLSNAAASTLYGAETEVAWKPISRMTIQVGAGYTDSRFASFNSSLGGDLTGKRLPSAPRVNANMLVHFEIPVGAATAWIEADGKYQSFAYFSANNDPILSQPAYTTVNARIGVAVDQLSLIAWCKNLSDKQYLVGAYDVSAFGFDQWVVGDPRTLGITIGYKFR